MAEAGSHDRPLLDDIVAQKKAASKQWLSVPGVLAVEVTCNSGSGPAAKEPIILIRFDPDTDFSRLQGLSPDPSFSLEVEERTNRHYPFRAGFLLVPEAAEVPAATSPGGIEGDTTSDANREADKAGPVHEKGGRPPIKVRAITESNYLLAQMESVSDQWWQRIPEIWCSGITGTLKGGFWDYKDLIISISVSTPDVNWAQLQQAGSGLLPDPSFRAGRDYVRGFLLDCDRPGAAFPSVGPLAEREDRRPVRVRVRVERYMLEQQPLRLAPKSRGASRCAVC